MPVQMLVKATSLLFGLFMPMAVVFAKSAVKEYVRPHKRRTYVRIPHHAAYASVYPKFAGNVIKLAFPAYEDDGLHGLELANGQPVPTRVVAMCMSGDE